MVRQPLDVLGQPVRIGAFDGADDASVQGLAPVLEQGAVCDFMGEGVLERVLEVREAAGLVEELGGLERFESAAERLVRDFGDRLEQREWDVRADDGGDLEETLVLGRQPVDARRQNRLDRGRNQDRLDRLRRPSSAFVSTSVRTVSSRKNGFPSLIRRCLRGASPGSAPRSASSSSPALSAGSASSRSWR
jgi:hypothetical protein